MAGHLHLVISEGIGDLDGKRKVGNFVRLAELMVAEFIG